MKLQSLAVVAEPRKNVGVIDNVEPQGELQPAVRRQWLPYNPSVNIEFWRSQAGLSTMLSSAKSGL